MKFLIQFLLISSRSIIIAETASLPTESEMKEIIEGDQSNITGSPETNLKLLKEGELYRKKSVLVWKGTYNDATDVAIKIVNRIDLFEKEIGVFERLNATEDSDIEKHRIPRVHYHGSILGEHFAIAMTLFDETLENRFKYHDKIFSEPTILLIFKQIIEALKYIHGKNVVHNDIALRNIFIRGQDVFLGDFDCSELYGGDPMSDYEKLFVWIWRMAGVPENIRYILDDADKLEYFKNRIVRKTFKSILKIKNIQREYDNLPNHEVIIKTANDALTEISGTLEPLQFDWLKKRKIPSSGESSRHRKSRK